ncbi:aminoglycoside N(3)-acetyltransferase [Indioceanicola profundi]|uniref:aminoglycoside N(3)-acetyltransferase n=1 Tax=Indioceanicola profundi TaxID=2220096 RepID=UPI000E6AB833|nr:AAC(3) family N-acetyltransferase [Indioceanicola profundi]
MARPDIYARTTGLPVTRPGLAGDLAELGLRPGMNVLVHTAMGQLGWVVGGAITVIRALEDVLGNSGTLIMPAHTADLSDPEFWQNPAVPPDWWALIRAQMPAFDPDLTPTNYVGVVPETFRHLSGVTRSNHPQVSFCARGPRAEFITANHSLEFGLGEGSPLARLYDLGGHVLLLGATHYSNTILHLAEYRAIFSSKVTVMNGAPVMRGGGRRWVTFMDLDLNTEDFPELGLAFEATCPTARIGPAGYGTARLLPVREMVDFAVQWMTRNRL